MIRTRYSRRLFTASPTLGRRVQASLFLKQSHESPRSARARNAGEKIAPLSREPPRRFVRHYQYMSGPAFSSDAAMGLLAGYTGLYPFHTLLPALAIALCNERRVLLHSSHAYQIILVCSGFALVFRLNLSHARYWEARTAVQNCSAKWLDGAMI